MHQADPQMCDIHLEQDRHLIQGMDTASPEPDSSFLQLVHSIQQVKVSFLGRQQLLEGPAHQVPLPPFCSAGTGPAATA